MEQIKNFLIINGFEETGPNYFENKYCYVDIVNERHYAVGDRSMLTLYSRDLNGYWLIGVLTYHGFIDKNYKACPKEDENISHNQFEEAYEIVMQYQRQIFAANTKIHTILLNPRFHPMSIRKLNVPNRVINALENYELNTIGQVLQLRKEDALRIRNFGRQSWDELQKALIEFKEKNELKNEQNEP